MGHQEDDEVAEFSQEEEKILHQVEIYLGDIIFLAYCPQANLHYPEDSKCDRCWSGSPPTHPYCRNGQSHQFIPEEKWWWWWWFIALMLWKRLKSNNYTVRILCDIVTLFYIKDTHCDSHCIFFLALWTAHLLHKFCYTQLNWISSWPELQIHTSLGMNGFGLHIVEKNHDRAVIFMLYYFFPPISFLSFSPQHKGSLSAIRRPRIRTKRGVSFSHWAQLLWNSAPWILNSELLTSKEKSGEMGSFLPLLES